ncbi:multidrug transporter [Solibacillus sp. Sa1YVA6]|uniref:Multidrug transporter n=2 Tax=Caryophanaceae TaxID=186818 RepID=A0ABR8XIK7_9BACL|nr:multidrug transporter [Solibacillus merdavium]
MFGSIFYNLWAALLSFAVYFIWAIQNPYALPFQIISTSFLVAFIAFCGTYFLRYFLGYVFYTPETPVFVETEDEIISKTTIDESNQQFTTRSNQSTMEFDEENTEDIAQVVRTMLHGDEALSR